MKRGRHSKENLNSKASIRYIHTFYRLEPYLSSHSKDKAKHVDWYNYSVNNYTFIQDCEQDRAIRNFPVIYRGNGYPWDLANLYLYRSFCDSADFTTTNAETYQRKATDLLAYLRWLENEQLSIPAIDEFYTHRRKSARVTYRYRAYVQDLVSSGKKAFSGAQQRMRTIAHFYRFIAEHKLGPADSIIAGVLYETRSSAFISKSGRVINRTTTDLQLRGSIRPVKDFERIYGEEEGVKPLSPTQEKWVRLAIKNLNNRQQELMHNLALFSGARKQTICTLTVKAVTEAYLKYQDENTTYLKVGPGTDIDTKFNVQYILEFPTKLLEEIYNWVKYSPIYKRYAEKSFYKLSERNYAFLNNRGNPFYTAKREILDRETPEFLNQLDSTDISNFTINTGSSLNHWITNYVIPWINNNIDEEGARDFKHYKFHDLRATRAMKYVRSWQKAGGKHFDALLKLKELMGHKSEITTGLYIDYEETTNMHRKHHQAVESDTYDDYDV